LIFSAAAISSIVVSFSSISRQRKCLSDRLNHRVVDAMVVFMSSAKQEQSCIS